MIILRLPDLICRNGILADPATSILAESLRLAHSPILLQMYCAAMPRRFKSEVQQCSIDDMAE
jgi:hypothetical protein